MFFRNRNNQNNVTSNKAYHELLRALDYDSCPVCTVLKNYIVKYFDDLLYEAVNDIDRRKTIKNSLGFCKKHAHVMYSLGDPLGHSILYSDLINVLTEKTYQKATSGEIPLKYQKCPACIFEEEQEKYLISVFLKSVEIQEFFNKYRGSFGLCFPHFKKIVEFCEDNNTLEKIKKTEIQIFSELRNELNEFVRKCDYRFSNEGFSSEKNSWIRAIKKLVGDFN
ncbi:MAG: DUF6062 family protein [Kosmotogaceae bacterium]